MKPAVALLLLLGACGDDRESYEAPLKQNTLHSSSGGISFEWSGPTADYQFPMDAAAALDQAFGEWISEGWARPEPFKVHYAHTVKAKTFLIELVVADTVMGAPYSVSGFMIYVPMLGDYVDTSTGLLYHGVGRVKLAWDAVNGFR